MTNELIEQVRELADDIAEAPYDTVLKRAMDVVLVRQMIKEILSKDTELTAAREEIARHIAEKNESARTIANHTVQALRHRAESIQKDKEISRLREALGHIESIESTRPVDFAYMPFDAWYYKQLSYAKLVAKQALGETND
jgi:hypothetical protein